MNRLCAILLDCIREIEAPRDDTEASKVARGRLEALADILLHTEVEIDTLHDQLSAALEKKNDEIWWRGSATMVPDAICRIKREKERLAVPA